MGRQRATTTTTIKRLSAGLSTKTSVVSCLAPFQRRGSEAGAEENSQDERGGAHGPHHRAGRGIYYCCTEDSKNVPKTFREYYLVNSVVPEEVYVLLYRIFQEYSKKVPRRRREYFSIFNLSTLYLRPVQVSATPPPSLPATTAQYCSGNVVNLSTLAGGGRVPLFSVEKKVPRMFLEYDQLFNSDRRRECHYIHTSYNPS